MIPKKQKNKKSFQGIIISLAIVAVILSAVGFLLYSNWKTNQRRADLNERIESLKNEVKNLEEKKKELESSADQSLGEDYLEKVAREQLNLKKPGEQVVTVITPEGEKKQEPAPVEKSFWQKILEKLSF